MDFAIVDLLQATGGYWCAYLLVGGGLIGAVFVLMLDQVYSQ